MKIFLKRISVLGITCLVLALMLLGTHAYADKFTWTERSGGVLGNVDWRTVALSSDGSYMYAATAYSLKRSSNSGVSWESIATFSYPETITDVSTSGDGLIVALTTTSGAYFDSTYAGSALQLVANGDFLSSAVSLDGSHIFFGVSSGNSYYSADSGLNFTVAAGLPELGVSDVAISNDNSTVYVIDSNSCLDVSTDGGSYFNQLSCDGYTHVATDDNGQDVLVSTAGGYLLISGNGGNTFASPNIQISGRSWKSVSMSGTASILAAVSNTGDVYTSNNFGSTWTLEVLAPNQSLWNDVGVSSDGYIIIAGSSDAYIWTGTFDVTAPNILSITSSLANGVYKVGQAVPITVTFDKPVYSSSLVLTLETGTTDRTCTLSIVDGSSSGTCTYTVQSGDTSSDLSVNSASGNLKNGNLYSRTSGFTNLTTLAVSKSIVIDTTSPSVSLSAPTNASNVSGTISVTATASDTNLVGVQFKWGTTNIGSEDTSSPYATTLDTTELSDGSYTISAVGRDSAGNYATSSVTVTVNNTVSSGGLSSTYTVGANGVVTSSYNQYHVTPSSFIFTSPNTPQITIATSTLATNTTEIVKATNPIFTNQTYSRPQVGLQIQKQFFKNTNGTPFAFNSSINLSSPQSMDVKKLQVFLNSIGYTVSATGPGSIGLETSKFGPATRNALLNFQKAVGIKGANGVFGPATRMYVNMILKNFVRQ